MKLATVLSGGLESTRYLERYVNNVRVGDHSHWSDTSPEFSPHFGDKSFLAPCWLLSQENVDVVESNPDPRLQAAITANGVLFVIHPEMLRDEQYMSRLPPLESKSDGLRVTPTSSTRTLLTEGRKYNFMIKTDLDKRHYGFVRSLKRSGVVHSVAICQELGRLLNGSGGDELAYLPESIGVILKGTEVGETPGVIFRETAPRPHVEESRALVPYFSLYAHDMTAPEDYPLLVQLIKLHAKQAEEADYFIESIISPLLRVWTKFVLEYGILLEMHGQNTLVEMDGEFNLRRLVVRDFQGLYLDPTIRAERRLGLPSAKCLVGSEQGITRAQQYSHLYDYLIGRLLLHRLTKTFTQYFSAPTYEVLARRITDVFHESMQVVDGFFPDEAYGFEKIVRDSMVIWIEKDRRPPVFR